MLPGMWGRADFEIRRLVAHARDCYKPFICINSFNLYNHCIRLVCCYILHFTNGETEAQRSKCAQVTQLIDGRAGTRTQKVQPPGLALLTTHYANSQKQKKKSQETCLVSTDMAQSSHLHSSLRSSPFTEYQLNDSGVLQPGSFRGFSNSLTTIITKL